jgi:N-acetylglucosamine-6-sulfatase
MSGLTRRTLLTGAVATGLAATAQRAACGATIVRPNVLWIITDDQMRSSLPYMPRVNKRLVGRGTRFSNGYAAIPLCGPARASMVTGLYPHNHGALTNATHQSFVAAGRDRDTVATRMKAAGYETGYFGKYMNGTETDPTYIAPGWDRWVNWLEDLDFNVDGEVRTINQTHVDPYSAAKCLNFIETRASTPWFAVFAPRNPHTGGGFEPSAEHADDYDGVAWDPTSLNEADMSDKPSHMQDLATRRKAEMRETWEHKLEELQDTDDQIESLLDALALTGQLERTFVFFVSDNGYMLGEHRLVAKGKPYEEATGIPFVVTGPGVPVGVNDALVSQVDLMPTTLAVAGVDPDAGGALDGRPMLVPLTSGDWTGWRRRLLVEHQGNGWSMLREGSHTYTCYHGLGEREMYDLSTDPAQMQNLYGNGQVPEPAALYHLRLKQMKVASGLDLRALEVTNTP